MNSSIASLRISQLPMVISGIFFTNQVNGIRLSIFTKTMTWRKDSPALT
ncbi:RAxF-45 family protein [Paenibacillus senegalensis]|nr:RAxF-45 family protein [Paenibacillus senegalensis]